MSDNKRTVEQFLDGLTRGDHRQTLSCLADDVDWEVPGMFHLWGKDVFGQELEQVCAITIEVTRLTEENDVVVAEGSVRTQNRDGGIWYRAFCDVFVMRDARIQRLTTYLMDVE